MHTFKIKIMGSILRWTSYTNWHAKRIQDSIHKYTDIYKVW